jgi:hypothetical protein
MLPLSEVPSLLLVPCPTVYFRLFHVGVHVLGTSMCALGLIFSIPKLCDGSLFLS